VVVIAVDQISKHIIKTNMDVGESFNFIPNILNIRYIENPGASFGILADHRWVFMTFSTIALIFMFGAIFYLNRKDIKKYNRLPNIALALMFGGGIGNMIDRLFNESEVREGVKVVVDFLEFDFVNFAIFNFADTFITVGSVLFCVSIFCGKYKVGGENENTEITEIIEEFLEDTGENL
jgi:signal peptidase II